MAVKQAWLGLAASSWNLSPGEKIGKRKFNVGFSVMGGANATTLVEVRGPAHLKEGDTKSHIIGAKLLGTRNSIRNKSKRIGVNAAFGGSNRGVFGSRQRFVNYNEYGSVRQQAAKGVLRERAGKKALTIGGNLRAYAFHPGTQGAHAWPTFKAAAIRIGPETYADEYKKALIKSGFGAGQSVLGALK
ncbi:hypothetical protein UFOVP196_20 [uncultured Caudovirales phage]|uniref:Uncharacterized protein n=1 Tax=uncultured Caudovirales phage TaxID=2100421 RepID=A0A6J7WI87_9CAUD|nr:hypothetical protein UFOVP196_20 [uncultured Caudovirales phage]